MQFVVARGAALRTRKPFKRLERNFYFTFGVRIRRFLDRQNQPPL